MTAPEPAPVQGGGEDPALAIPARPASTPDVRASAATAAPAASPNRGAVAAPRYIRFAHKSARLDRTTRRFLDEMATMIRAAPAGGVIKVEGHCDRAEKNGAVISLRRAKAVVAYLIKKGVPKEKLKAVGYAATQSVAGSGSEQERLQNRRVELSFVEEQL